MSAADMDVIVKTVGWENLLNTRSTTWRGLDDAGKGDMNEGKAVLMMGEHPTLIKRPVIMDGERVTVGWRPEQQAVWIN
ncbi:ArsC/Spx/MgsR family protein [Litorimonas sp. RW-G-Af-16]